MTMKFDKILIPKKEKVKLLHDEKLLNIVEGAQ